MKKLYIHIGYPKTGTTSLQIHFFSKLAGFYTIVPSNYTSARFDSIKKDLNKFNLSSYNKGILSYEPFLDIHGNLLNNLLGKPKYHTFDEALSFLKEISTQFDVEIICTLRFQYSFLRSYYAETYNNRYSNFIEINTFNKFMTLFCTNEIYVENIHDDINYLKLYENLLQIFLLKEKIHFLLFEELQFSEELFLDKLSNILKIPASIKYLPVENKRSTGMGGKNIDNKTVITVITRLLINRGIDIGRLSQKFPIFKKIVVSVFGKLVLNNHKAISDEILFNKYDNDAIKRIYSKDNEKLSKLKSLNMDRYDYF
jgi:hypothetical protein